MLKIIGLLLIVLGVIGLVYGGVSYTTQETVLDVGPVELATEKEETIPLPPLVGGLSLLAGAGLLVAAGRK